MSMEIQLVGLSYIFYEFDAVHFCIEFYLRHNFIPSILTRYLPTAYQWRLSTGSL